MRPHCSTFEPASSQRASTSSFEPSTSGQDQLLGSQHRIECTHQQCQAQCRRSRNKTPVAPCRKSLIAAYASSSIQTGGMSCIDGGRLHIQHISSHCECIGCNIVSLLDALMISSSQYQLGVYVCVLRLHPFLFLPLNTIHIITNNG